MPPKDPAPTEDLLQIQIAIELDRGRKVAEIASEFQVPEKKVRNIARNAGLLESKKSSSARKRLSEEEKEVLLGRIEAGEDPEELASGVGIKTSTPTPLVQGKRDRGPPQIRAAFTKRTQRNPRNARRVFLERSSPGLSFES